jgi:hypothetical protein
VGADFEHHEAPFEAAEELVKRFARRGNLSPLEDRPVVGDDAQMTGAISEVTSDRDHVIVVHGRFLLSDCTPSA